MSAEHRNFKLPPRLEDLPAPPPGRTGWPWTEASPLVASGGSDHRITIVTPSYNQAEFIEETIRSVLLQGYANLEYIVMDGGSTDGSADIIRKYAPWLAYWTSEPDGGQVDALNKGFARATGTVYGYLNSDDRLTAGTLPRVAQAFTTAPSRRTLVYFAGAEFGEDATDRTYPPGLGPELDRWLSSEASLFQPSTFWTPWLHERVGGFDPSFNFCFDKDFFIKCVFRHGRYVPHPEWIAAEFRMHPASKTGRIIDVLWSENHIIWKKYLADPHYQRVLRRERATLTADALTRSALSAAMGFRKRSGALIEAARVHPRGAVSRFYLGAWKRVLLGARVGE